MTNHGMPDDPAELLTQQFWDARYRTADQIWSGNPNPLLVEHTAQLSPGTALDVGSGEGADAMWLAARGWQVTALDLSEVALERAAAHAAQVGGDIADLISWEHTDVLTWEPAHRQFDLVSAQFMHLPEALRDAMHRRLAAAVAPGGTLLIVGHHPSDLAVVPRPDLLGFMFTAEHVAALLDPEQWQLIDASAPARQAAPEPGGVPVTIHDALLRAVRKN